MTIYDILLAVDRTIELHFKGDDSPCRDCPISQSAIEEVRRKIRDGEEIDIVRQYCGIDKWLLRIAEVHQSVVFRNVDTNKHRIVENISKTGPIPDNCLLPR